MATSPSLNLLLEITAQFDALAARCSKELIEKRVLSDVDLQDRNDDVPAICMNICSFMQSQGFSVFRGELPVVRK